ncbi:hypothetical protein TW71_024345 (plasmid) [Vibrio coralliilyticus]|nr:hypothetical protein [Vibrio coralliilyticus]QOU33324.1 hypothetical protein TW71_024345 [Vibrio coralliilyticus]
MVDSLAGYIADVAELAEREVMLMTQVVIAQGERSLPSGNEGAVVGTLW